MNDQPRQHFVPLTAEGGRVTAIGFPVNVQHPKPNVLLPGQGDRSTDKPGRTDVSIVPVGASGVILVQTTHADGTTLGTFYTKPELDALRQCLDQAELQLMQMELAESEKPS